MERLIQNLVGFLETRLELLKLEVKEEAVKLLARVLLMVFLLLIFTMVVIMGSITLGFFLNELLQSAYLGLLIVTFGYFLIFIVLVATRNAPFWKSIFYKIIESESEPEKKEEHGESGEQKTAP